MLYSIRSLSYDKSVASSKASFLSTLKLQTRGDA